MADLVELMKLTNQLAVDVNAVEPALIRLSVLQKFLDNIQDMVCVLDKDLKLVVINKKFEEYLSKNKMPVYIGCDWYKCIWGLDKPPKWDGVLKAISTRQVIQSEFVSPKTGNKFSSVIIPMVYNGVSGVLAVAKIKIMKKGKKK